VTTHHLLLLPGDGIGPEVMAEVKRAIAWFNEAGGDSFDFEEDLVGGSCACARISPCSPISGRRSSIRRSPMPRR